MASRPQRARVLLTGALAALTLAGGSGALLAQERVGVNSAVNPDASGTPPGGTTRRLVLGQEVVYNERISTAAAGQTQVLFLDESSMSIGPNSEVTIDQFVYDPKSGAGKLAMSTTRGVLRFVGGKLSKQDNAVSVRSPTATIAVRGGAFLFNQKPDGSAEAIFIYGDRLQVTGATGATQFIRRPGFAISISGPGAAPSAPYPVPPGLLASLLTTLDGRSGGNGGALQVPTDPLVSNTVSKTISNDINVSIFEARQNQPGTTGRPPAVDVANLQQNNQVQNGFLSTVAANPQLAVQQLQPTQPTQPTPPTQQNVTITYAGAFKNTNGNATSRGFFDQSTAAFSTFSNGTLSFPPGQPQSGVFTGSVNGIGSLTIPLAPGTNQVGPSGTSSPFGPVTGTTYLSPDNSFFYASVTPSNFPNERGLIFGGQAIGTAFTAPTGNIRFFTAQIQQDPALQSPIPFIRNQAGGSISNPSVSPFYIVAPSNVAFGSFDGVTQTNNSGRSLQASLAISGQGPAQTSALVIGDGSFFANSANGKPVNSNIIRGSYLPNGTSQLVRIGASAGSVPDGAGNSIYGTNSISGYVLDQNFYDLNLSYQQQLASEVTYGGPTTTYGFAQPVTQTASFTPGSRTTRQLQGNFAGIMFPQTGGVDGNPYAVNGISVINTNAANSTVSNTVFAGADRFGTNTVTLQFGTAANSNRISSTFVDDNTFAANESQTVASQVNGQNIQLNGDPTQASRIALVSAGTVPNNPLLPNGLCQTCQFLTWGYWTGELDTPDGTGTQIARRDRTHIGTFVAGVPTPGTDISTLRVQNAVGTYAGNAFGSVYNNGATYLAAGGFQGVYNFGTQTGNLAITNFDGRNLATGNVSLPLTNGQYNASVTQAGARAAISGRFFGPMAAETGGSFAFQTTVGTPYLASGVFAAKGVVH